MVRTGTRGSDPGLSEAFAYRLAVDAQLRHQFRRRIGPVAVKNGQQQVFGGDASTAGPAHLGHGPWEDRPGRRRQGRALARGGNGCPLDAVDVDADNGQSGPVQGVQSLACGSQIDAEGSDRDRVGVVEQPQEKMFGTETAVAASSGLLQRRGDRRTGTCRELCEHRRLTFRIWRARTAVTRPGHRRSVPRTSPAVWPAPPRPPRPARPVGAAPPPPTGRRQDRVI